MFGKVNGANVVQPAPRKAPRQGMVPASFLAKLRQGGVIEATAEERAALRGERPGK